MNTYSNFGFVKVYTGKTGKNAIDFLKMNYPTDNHIPQSSTK